MELIVTTKEELRGELRELLKEAIATYLPPSHPQEEPVKYLYSIVELSRFLGCSPVTAQSLKNSGKIRFRQFGRKCIFSTAEVLEDLQNSRFRK